MSVEQQEAVKFADTDDSSLQSYLYIYSGGIPVLIDTSAVHEVMSCISEDISLGDNYEWRDQVIPAYQLCELLQLSSTVQNRNSAVVYQINPKASPILLLIDGITGLMKLQCDELVSLPPVPEKTAQFFDSVYSDINTDKQIYHLRNPLPDCLIEEVLL